MWRSESCDFEVSLTASSCRLSKIPFFLSRAGWLVMATLRTNVLVHL